MNTTQQLFVHWYFNDFRQTDPLYRAMARTVENSPWHREDSVGIHTDMVVAQYLALDGVENFDVRGAFACAFHDVGKPPAEQIKFREDRGEYKAFHGHEQVSARMWENWAVENWGLLRDVFGFVPRDIYTIGWMIEHHVPWGTKKDGKLDAFGATAHHTIGNAPTWAHVLLADQTGRISDPDHQRGEQALEWLEDHERRVIASEFRWTPYGDKKVYMLIGAPGCGKSTYRQQLLREHPDAAVISMDDCRIEFYGEPYDQAFAKASKDSSFGAKVDARYIETLRKNDVVILDNTNTAAKARNRWLAPARARDFQTVAVLFPVARQTVIDRQKTRKDKEIPAHVVEAMYDRMALPMIGDFDDVIVHDGNLPA